MQERGLISARLAELTWRAELTWCEGPARMLTCHVAEPTRRLGGAQVARTRGKVTRVHAEAWVAPRGSERGQAGEGPIG